MKAKNAKLIGNIEYVEMGVAELGNEQDQTYDVVMSGLCLSELTEEELDFAVGEVNRVLKSEGHFLVVDEVRPQRFLRRCIQGLFRSIFKLFVFLISGTTTRALKNFPDRVEKAGFKIAFCELNKSQNLLILDAVK